MASASKRAKMTTTTGEVSSSDDVDSSDESSGAPPQFFIPFQTGPSLEHVPDDVLYEIISYLPTLQERHWTFGGSRYPPVIPSTALVRTPTLRALSQTSRTLRSRCLTMAWQRVELCGARLPKHTTTFWRAIIEATSAAARVLNACPHLLPLVQTVVIVFTLHQSDEIVPEFAACLATLPNLTTVHIIHAHRQMTTRFKNGLEGKQFPTVRKISLPSPAHEIIKCCPNLEEVLCTEGDGSAIIGSLVKGNCYKVRVLKGISAPLKRLVKLLPNLRHVAVGVRMDVQPLSVFSLLETIEILVYSWLDHKRLPRVYALGDIKIGDASKVLRENKSQAEKTVIVTRWKGVNVRGLQDEGYVVREVFNVS